MEDIDSSPPSSNLRKRAAPDGESSATKLLNVRGTQFMMPTPPGTEESSNASPVDRNTAGQRAASPTPSMSTSSSVEIAGSGAVGGNKVPASKADQPPKKRMKLTPSEKAARDQEKAVKAQKRAEERAMKDEEKRVKDEEKRKKAEEREAKRREKELEEQRKQDEKLKKERSQLRLGVFFGASSTTMKPIAGSPAGSSAFTRRKSLSLEPFDAVANVIKTSQSPARGTPQPQPQPQPLPEETTPAPDKPDPTVSDYHKYFLPFELPSHSTLAPSYSLNDPADLAYLQGIFDEELKSNDRVLDANDDLGLLKPSPTISLQDLFARSASERGIRVPKLRQLVERFHGSSQRRSIDLTEESDKSAEKLQKILSTISHRHLQFHEDVRPAYSGTYTKIQSPRTSSILMRNPFARERTDTDYDYNSEEEWDESEGEDVIDDEDDDAESLGDADEMDGFLDDEDDVKQRRKMVTGDLQAVSTGLCWEDGDGNLIVESKNSDDDLAPKEPPLHGMRLGVLVPGFTGQTIDPFSTAYWANEMAPPALPILYAPLATSTRARLPLRERYNNNDTSAGSLLGAAQGEKGPITSVAAAQGSKRGPKPAAKTLSKEDLEEFKEAVVGSPLGKKDLCKGLKSRFPKMTNETIKDTLGSFFAPLGASKADKKWVFVGDS